MLKPAMARIRSVLRNLSPLLRPDYTLTQGYLRYFAIIGCVNLFAVHFIEARIGYRDCWPLRISSVLAPLPLLFFPRERKLKAWEIVYFEFSNWLTLPVMYAYLFLLNKPDAYWASTLFLIGLIMGLLTKPIWFFPQIASGLAAGSGLYAWAHGGYDPDSLGQLWRLLPNAFVPGFMTLGLQMGLHAFHRRGLALAEAKAKAREATLANEELLRRERVITRFVRPSLCAELAAGSDPTEYEPVEKDLAVLFCDIRDFTALTEVLGPREKQSFLNRYFSLMTRPIIANVGEVDKIMGDCVMGVFPEGRGAVKAAVEMRRELQELNAGLLAQGQPKIRNGIGIAKGPVLLGNFGSHEKLDRTVIGEAVNIASRLESKTKMYDLEIVVTEDVIRDLDPADAHWRWIDLVQLKGSSRNLRIFEVYSHQPAAVRADKEGTRELLEKALAIYFRKGFNDAWRLFQAMQAEVPPHLHAAGQPMDRLLAYYLDRCRAWMRDDPQAWERIQKWEGVHVFLEK